MKLWQTICNIPALFQAAHQPNQHPQCALSCPLRKKKKKNKAQERTAAFVKYHWQPSILSWEENLLRVKSVIAKPEALHRYVVLRKDRGTQLEVSRTAIIWDTLCKWARTLWLTTTKAWFISAPSVYELRRWRSLIKCCRGQQQCVQEKESIL